MLTKRWSLPSSCITWPRNPGYLPSRSLSTAPTVPPSACTDFAPPVTRCKTEVTRTSTLMCSLRSHGSRQWAVGSRGWFAARLPTAHCRLPHLHVARLARRSAAEGLVVDQLGDGGVVAAEGAVGVAARLDDAELHREGVVEQQPADEGLADGQHLLDHLGRLDRADRGAHRTQHAGLGAGRDHARR